MIAAEEISEASVCPVCSGPEFSTIAEVKCNGFVAYSTEHCADCGQIFRQRKPSAEFWDRYRKEQTLKEIRYDKASEQRRYDRYTKTGNLLFDIAKNKTSVLDIGCGIGTGLRAFGDIGWEKVIGIEAIPIRAALGAEFNNAEIVVTTIEDFDRTGEFGCITLIHALEHFAEPVAVLEKLNLLLTKDGLLFVEVPDFLKYVKWNDCVHFSHFQNFTAHSLIRTGLRAGLWPTHRVSTKTAPRGVPHLGIVFTKRPAGLTEDDERDLLARYPKASLAEARKRYTFGFPLGKSFLGQFPIQYEVSEVPVAMGKVVPRTTRPERIFLEEGRRPLAGKIAGMRNMSPGEIASLIKRRATGGKAFKPWGFEKIV